MRLFYQVNLYKQKEDVMLNKNVRATVEGAVMLAAATVLSLIKVYELPYGGTITACSMLPLVLFCVRYGMPHSLVMTFAYGILQYLTGNGMAIHWGALILDYLVAFGLIGLAGLFKNFRYSLIYASVFAGVLRFAVHFISGIVLWGEYMPDTFDNVYIYSLVYNGSYMLPETIILVIVSVLLYASKPLKKYILGEDLRNA